MQLRTEISLLSLCLLVIGGGCASSRSPLAGTPFGSKSTTATNKTESSAGGFLSAFRRNQNSKKSADTLPANDSNQSNKSHPIEQAAAIQPVSPFNTETRAMIDRALAGASPAEQTEMREALQSVPAESVPKILNAFRLSRQLSQMPRPPAQGAPGHHPYQSPSIANQPQSLGRSGGNARPGQNQFGGFSNGNRLAQQNQPPHHSTANPSHIHPGSPNNGSPQTAHVVPAGERVDLSQNMTRVNQADLLTRRDPSQPHMADRIGVYDPSKQNPLRRGAEMQQTQYGESRSPASPSNDLPIYQPGRNANPRFGNLTPGVRAPIPTLPPANSQTPGQKGFGPIKTEPTIRGDAPPVRQVAGVFNGQSAWRSQLSSLINTAEREVAQLRPGMGDDTTTRDYIENNVYLRMLYLMSGQQDQQTRAWEPIPGIDPAQQGFWQDAFFGITNYFDRNPELLSGERFGQTVKSFAHATTELRKAANLEIGDIAFCSGITNFGNYKRFETYEFSPGQNVALYAEIRNFVSQATDDNNYRVLLQSTIEFLTPGNGPLSGRAVQKPLVLKPVEDLCKYPRHDFYIAYTFEIPRELPQGRYVLKLTVTDKLGNKVTESTVNFTVQ